MEKLLLIVDDDTDDIEFFCDALKEIDEDYFCVYAYNADYAWNYLMKPENKPAYIFLDLNLPRVSGKEFLMQIRKEARFNDVPVIMYSASTMQKEIDELYELGASYYLEKPTSFKALKEALHMVLSKEFLRYKL